MVQTCRGIMQKHHWLWFGLDTHIASPFKILPWVLVCAPCPAVAAATSGVLQHCSGKPVQYCRRVPHQHQWQKGGEGVNRIGIGIGRRIFIWLGREARRSYQCWWVAPPTSSAERAAADCSTVGSIHKQRNNNSLKSLGILGIIHMCRQ